MAELVDGERRLLALERVWSGAPGADINGPAATPEYRRLVDKLTGREQAEVYAPIITHALRRKREERTPRRRPGPPPRLWMSGAIAAMVATGASVIIPRVIQHLEAVASLTI